METFHVKKQRSLINLLGEHDLYLITLIVDIAD
jgi:hypothetical protein